MSILMAFLLPFAGQQPPEPEEVKAGWVAFGLFLALAAALVLLAFSLVKHLKRVNFEEDPSEDGEGSNSSAAP